MKKYFSEIKSLYKKYENLSNIIMISILIIFVFANSLGAYFSEVDDMNSLLHTDRDLKSAIFTNTYGYKIGGNYRPIEVLSHQFDKRLYGDESYTARRITNITVHIFNALLVYFLALYVSKKKVVGLIAGLLFGLNIVNGNPLPPVAWISGRVDPFVTFFMLISLMLFIRFLSSKSLIIYFLSFISYIFALWSKEMALTFPFLLVSFLLFFYGMKKQEQLSRLDKIILPRLFLTSAGLLFLVAIILTPEIASTMLSHDGILSDESLAKLRFYRLLAFSSGGLAVIIFALVKTSKGFLRLIASQKFVIPYFIIMIIYMLVRVEIIGGIGGNYSLKSGENQIFQFGLDSFMRDALALAGFVFPMGNDYNMTVFRLQIETPILFYAISVFIILSCILIFLWLIKTKLKIHAFFFSWIFISLSPAHNSLIAIGQYQSRYLYLPAVGFCIFVTLIFYGIMQNKNFHSQFSKYAFSLIMIFVIVMNSFFIVKTNDKMIRSGEIVKQFVKDVGEHKEKILAADNLIFINFPLSPVNSRDAVFVDFLLHEPLHYCDGLFNYRKAYNYSIFTYNNKNNNKKIGLNWADNNSFIISGSSPSHTYVIPSKVSTRLEERIEEIYTIKPHAQLQLFDSLNPKRELKNAVLEVLKWDNSTNHFELMVKLNEQFVQNAGCTLFFIYDEGRFRLANEIDYNKTM